MHKKTLINKHNVGTLVESSEILDKEKTQERTSVCVT